MAAESDPLATLLEIKSKMQTELSDDLLQACYKLQFEHQYDNDRTTQREMRDIVEKVIEGKEDGASS